MKTNFLILFVFLLFSNSIFAQRTVVTGTIIDGKTKEPLSFSNISCGNSGVTSDLDGNYSLDLVNGAQEISFSYVGYEEVVKEVVLEGGTYQLDIEMGSSVTLKEIEVVADIAMERKTPVAFTNIPTKKILEEIAGEDIAAMVNTVPGAQYTQQGGGDGDARITIRGFNQRNVAVMIDGIPVNDMENGWVYWSNWFGLDVATKTVQVQRGLGASKLAIPSVGGTMNILTKGIESKRKIMLKQQIGNNGFTQTTVGVTSGRLNGGWGITAAGSYKQGNGWVDQNYTQGGFYYLKIDKELGNHILTLSGMGAPQNHGQRSYKTHASVYDIDYARDKLGFSDSTILEQYHNHYGNANLPPFLKDSFDLATYKKDRRYNQHWGEYTNSEGETILLNERKNYYHKPQYSLRHSWDASQKFFLSNILYASIGNGGGTGRDGNIPLINGMDDRGTELFGQRNFQSVFNGNTASMDADGEYGASTILRTSVNNHRWFGLLSTFNYGLSDLISISGGIDLRTYKGQHKREVYDLLGGDYFLVAPNRRNQNEDPNKKLGVGDQYFYHNDGLVRWGGVFGLVEVEKNNFAAFVNVSSALTGYSKIDYNLAKQIELADSTLTIGYDDVVTYDGQTYDRNSASLEYRRADWKTIPSFIIKGGAKYNINRQHSVFANLGYLSKAARFDNVIFGLSFYEDYKNEIIQAAELGYNFKSKLFSSKINGYWTNWKNKPETYSFTDPDSGERFSGNINGIQAIHTGVEVDFAFKPIDIVSIEGLMSLGNWKWNSGGVANLISEDGNPAGSILFDATGVHVGDAAQTQLGGLIRVEPIKNLYFKLKGTYFANYYSDFAVNTLQEGSGNEGRESWKLPAYAIFDAHVGYKYKFKKKVSLALRFNLKNVFDTTYIGDAANNDNFLPGGTNSFDAASAGVFLGQGRRFNTSFTLSF